MDVRAGGPRNKSGVTGEVGNGGAARHSHWLCTTSTKGSHTALGWLAERERVMVAF